MSVEKEIKRIIDGMGLDYIIETLPRANKVLDRYRRRADKRVKADDGHTLPVGIYIQPKNGTLNVSSQGRITDAPSCLISFADEMPFDFKGEEAQEVAERMKALCEEFVREVNSSDVLKPIAGNVAYDIVYDSLDANLCVVTMRVTLEEAYGRCV
jgi:hypothetical protein